MQKSTLKNYMLMRKFKAKGGYGEHGRSCFFVKYGQEGKYYIVDCGIMDTDPFPYPEVSKEELEKADYLFLTHCHKDHAGAFSYFVEHGFDGWLVATEMTLKLSKIKYKKTKILSLETEQREEVLEGIVLRYGRSGHCPGSVWLHLTDRQGSCFFSGDYQRHALTYVCDFATDITADLAVVDCAHQKTMLLATELQERLAQKVKECVSEGNKVIFPVPSYGRGLELLYLLEKLKGQLELKRFRYRIDEKFFACMQEMISEKEWYYEEPFQKIREVLEKREEYVLSITDNKAWESEFDILLLADTHLQKEENRRFVQKAISDGAKIFITGRLKKNSFAEKLYLEGTAERFLYPHHQSRGDMEAMLEDNHFRIVLPFHNEEQEVLFTNFDKEE